MARGRGREERKEVRWVWMGRKGFGLLGLLGLGFGVDLEAALLSHGKSKGMAAVAGGEMERSDEVSTDKTTSRRAQGFWREFSGRPTVKDAGGKVKCLLMLLFF